MISAIVVRALAFRRRVKAVRVYLDAVRYDSLMPLRMIEELGVRFVEGMRGESLMLRAQDATLVIEACFSGRNSST